MNARSKAIAAVAFLGLATMGCGTQDIPPAHKGQMLDRTGALALFSGGAGISGPVLGPGTYYTGIYDEVRYVSCGQLTKKEEMSALTKDGVQFGLHVFMRFSPVCTEKSIQWMLINISPQPSKSNPDSKVIAAWQLYTTYVRPAIGEAVRETVSPYIANEVNNQRDTILNKIRERFMQLIAKATPHVVQIHEVNLSHLDFPDAMDKANTDRATQAVLKDKAIAERERVEAEIKTMEMRRRLSESEGDAVAAKIDRVGAALSRNPAYLQYNMQSMMPEIYKTAGDKGNLVVAAPSPQLLLSPHVAAK